MECAVSIYSSRETAEVLAQTIEFALRGMSGLSSVLDVIVNGNLNLARGLAADARLCETAPRGVRIRVWNITLGDKAFAWNEYVHRIAPTSRAYVFIDGYVRVDVGAIKHLTHVLGQSDNALAATGVPRVGLTARRVAKSLQRDGGMHGNLYALKACTVVELRRIGFRLPLGIYRTDPTLGAALGFGLNLFEREWRPKERIVLDAAAGWDLTPLAWWRPRDLRTAYRRRQRQAQGLLENAAVRETYALRSLPFEQLPSTAAGLVEQWIEWVPAEALQLLSNNSLARKALAHLREPRDWSAHLEAPQLLLDQLGTAPTGLDAT